MKFKTLIFITAVLLATSCDYFKKTEEGEPVARVNESYLYYDDIKDLTTDATSKEDSTLLVQNFINNWATQQLFMDGAMLNLSEEQQDAYNKLVEQYKNDLYTKAYIEGLVKNNLDTTLNNDAAQAYYEKNKEAFKLNEELIKMRYVHVDENIINFKTIKEKFERFNLEDKKALDSMSIQFKSFSLNDSIWVRVNQVMSKIAVINPENKNELLKKSNFLQLKDSLGVYLMQINDVLLRNDTAPLEYVKPTIRQIVINKRKLELIRELKKDITKDAIKNKQFEIYN
ncbi:peptidyl-prolyl cis-trans isomerase [Hwangdonia lutea]|uniref:Peptidyl-prolyl cis-trans isomerase n=1 Tax=Hwangdonia lutea TaxID=3075823 RepID=A0AA97EJV1_9FLAO|nr:peptidyl-prolyl cis-trans isomerase [Hwangdonia sp. SCSIO 19198]WOD42582.1 peptidyl-prolyl cis-trans isomerase [Hwangdonia sp. SCSIO 19198]